MKKYLYIVLLIIIFSPSKVFAYCTNSESIKLKSISSNINIIYEPVEDDNVTFNVIINNLSKNIKLKDTSSNKYYTIDGELVIKGYKPGDNITYKIYGNTKNCNEFIDTRHVSFPSYNKYYKDKLCEGISSYKLCNKWTKVNISYEEFKKSVTDYKNSLIKEEEVIVDNTKGLFDMFIDLYVKYYYFFYGAIIVILIPIIIKYRDKISYFRR